jgi:uncharacterized Zn-finger protein
MSKQPNHHNQTNILYVNSKKVSCDGFQGASTHPLVYLDMGRENFVVCPYCSKNFTINQKNILSNSLLKENFFNNHLGKK